MVFSGTPYKDTVSNWRVSRLEEGEGSGQSHENSLEREMRITPPLQGGRISRLVFPGRRCACPGLFSRRPFRTKDRFWPADRLKPQVPSGDFVHAIALEKV